MIDIVLKVSGKGKRHYLIILPLSSQSPSSGQLKAAWRHMQGYTPPLGLGARKRVSKQARPIDKAVQHPEVD